MELSNKQLIQLLSLFQLTEAETFAGALSTQLNKKEHQPFKEGEEAALRAEYNNPATSERRKNEIKDEIVARHWLFVKSIVNKYVKAAQQGGYRVDAEDLFQEGIFGLLKAIDKFDFEEGVNFSTYANSWVRKYILSFLEQNNPVKVSREDVLAYAKDVKAAKKTRSSEENPDPTATPLYRTSKLDTGDYDEDEGGRSTFNLFDVHEMSRQEQAVMQDYMERAIDRVASENPRFAERSKDIMLSFYGIGRDEEKLEDIAARKNMSYNQVNNIKNGLTRALEPLLASLAKQKGMI